MKIFQNQKILVNFVSQIILFYFHHLQMDRK